MAYKVFTNGSVLNASEINENLMRQSVMVFSNAAARTAAITSPVEGMLTWLEDVNRYENYNGTAWVSPFGLTLLNTTTFTSATTVNVDNVFTSAFVNYKIIVTATAAAGHDSAFTLRAGGVNSTVSYNDAYLQANGGSASAVNTDARPSVRFGRLDSLGGYISWEISRPALAVPTYGVGQSLDSLQFLRSNGFRHAVSSAFDGFSILFNNTTGVIRTYGIGQ
jgi:hypothetical protein